MRIACLQNHPVEGPGRIADWAESRGFELAQYHGFADSFPRAEDYDAIVVMGGSMSVNDAGDNPHLAGALDCVGTFLEAGKATLGVCLGAQMVAIAAGGRVTPGPQKEIGWFPLTVMNPLSRLLPDGITVFHWHGEQVEPCDGLEILAATPVCPVQAFRLGEKQLGFQFHLEASESSLEAMLSAFEAEVSAGGKSVQKAAEMREGLRLHGENCRRHLFEILDDWAGV